MEQNNFILDLVASLLQSKSKKQVESDIKSMGDIKIPLVGTLSPKTAAQIKKDIASLNGEVNISGKANTKEITNSVQQATQQVQKQMDSKPVEVAFSVKKEKLLNDIKLLAQQNSKLFKNSDMTIKYNSLLDNAELAKNTVELSALRTQLGSFRSELKITGNAGLTMTDALKNGLSKVLQLFGSHGIIVQFTTQLRKAWTEAKELDKSMTDLSRVNAEITRSGFPDYLDRVIDKTKQLAVATKDYIDAVTTFSRAGYDLADSETLADMAVQLEKVGDMDSVSASKALLAGLQGYIEIDGYGMDQLAEKAQALNDKIDIIGNTASLTQKQAAEGIQAVGSVMSDANTSIDEFLALLGAGNRAVQDSDKVALAIRTSALRIRSCTSELREMGEETDNVIESTSTLAEKIKALTNINGSGGVNILEEDEETFRSIYDIYNDIAKVYDKMSDTDSSALLDLIAGKNRSNQISAILQNMSEANELLERSLSATGTASAEYEVYLNSAEAATERFGVAMTEAYSKILNGETVKGLANTGAAVLDFANSWNILEGTLKGFLALGVLKGVTTLTVAFKNSALQISNYGTALDSVKKLGTYAQDTTDYVKALNTLKISCVNLTDAQLKQVLANKNLEKSQLIEILQLKNLKEEEREARLAQLGLIQTTETQTVANGAATASTFSFSAAIKGLGVSIKEAFMANPIGVTIMSISLAYSVISTVISRYKESVVDASEATKEAIDTFESITSEVESLEDKLSELNEQISKLDPITDAEDIENLKAETEELNTQLAILKEKQRIAGADADKAAQKSLGMTEASRYKTEERESAYGGVESGAAYVTKDEELRNAIEAYEEYKAKVDEANKSLANMAETGEYTKDEWNEQEQIVSTYSDKMDDARSHANELANTLEEQKQGLDGNTESSQELLIKIDDVITEYETWLEDINGVTKALEEQADVEKEVSEKAESISFDQAWAESFTSENDKVKELGDSLLELAEKGRLTKESFNEADSNAGGYFKNLGISADEAVSKINALVDEAKQLSSMSSQISSMAEALGTKKENGFVSADTLAGFDVEVRGLESWDRFQSVLGSTTSSYKECQEAANALATEWVNSSDFLAQLTEQNEEYYKTQLQAMGIENYEEVISYAQALNEAKEVLAQSSLELGNATQDEIEALIAEGQYSELTANMILALYDAKIAEQAVTLDTAADCENLIALAGDTDRTSRSIELLIQLMDIYNGLESGAYNGNRLLREEALAEVDRIKKELEALANGESDGIEIEPTVKLGSKGKSSAKSAGKSAADAYIKAFEKEYSHLKDMLNRGEISEAQYLSRLRALYTKYFKDRKKYLDEFKKYESEYLSGMLDLHNKALSGISTLLNRKISAANDAKDASISALEEEKEKAAEVYQSQIDDIEKEKDAIDDLIKEKNKKISALNAEIDAIERAAESRKKNIQLEKDQYALEKMLNQKTSLVYKDGQFVYQTDTSGVRDAREKVREDQEALQIDNLKNKISLIQKEIDLLEEKKDALSEEQDRIQKLMDESNKYYDNLIKEQQKMWDSMIKNMEQQKSRWEELAEVKEIAEEFSYIQQVFGDLGYTVEDVLNGSDEAFEAFKSQYISLISDVNNNSDFTDGLVYATGVAKENLGSFLDKTKETAEGLDELGEKGSEMDSVADGIDKISDSATSASTSTGGLSDNLSTINDTLTAIPEADKFNSLTTSFTNLGDAIKGVADALGVGEGGTVSGLVSALQEISTLSIDGVDGSGGIISQFETLKSAVEDVTSAISGGSSSGGDASGSSSASMSTGAGGEGTSGLIGAIEEFKTATDEALGGGSGEGEGSEGGGTGAIPQFEELKTAVDDVTAAIGSDDSESSGEGESDNLIGSIVNLGETSEETLGESGGDGIIGRFEEFRDVIEDAAIQVASISEGLDEIDGKEVECTITINVKMNGSIPAFASGTVLGNMQIESATYNAQYGKAFASGTIGLKHDEKNALRSEYGQPELTVYPNGTTELTTSPVMSDLPKGTVIYNEEETKKIMGNKVNGVGNAHADGTIQISNSKNSKYDPDKDDSSFSKLYKAWTAYYGYIDKNVDEINKTLSKHLAIEHSQKMNKEVTEFVSSTSSVVNNTRNVQQPVAIQIGDINLTGVQDMNGLSQAIKTRLPGQMMQEYFKN